MSVSLPSLSLLVRLAASFPEQRLLQWHAYSSSAQHLFINCAGSTAFGKLAVDHDGRNTLIPSCLALAATCGSFISRTFVSQDGQAMRLTVLTASSHTLGSQR